MAHENWKMVVEGFDCLLMKDLEELCSGDPESFSRKGSSSIESCMDGWLKDAWEGHQKQSYTAKVTLTDVYREGFKGIKSYASSFLLPKINDSTFFIKKWGWGELKEIINKLFFLI